jgi:hypothetical protein
MNEADIRKIVSETVAETLLKLGIDTTDPIELQRDMQHLRGWREASATIKRQSIITVIGLAITGTGGAIWYAIKGG